MNNSVPMRISKAGLYVFAFTLPVSHVPAQFGIFFAVLGWLGEGLVNKRWLIRGHRFLAVLVFYLFWNVLSALLSPRPLHSLLAVGDNEWPALLMIVMFWSIRDVKTLSRILYLFFATSSIAMVYGIWQTFNGYEFYRGMVLDSMGGGFHRSVGFYGFYLTYAAFAMTVFFLSTMYVLEKRGTMKWRMAYLPVVSFMAVVGTFARSIWLSFVGVIPFLGFLRGKKVGWIVATSFFALVSLGIITVPSIRLRAESIIDIRQNETRINLWKTSIKIAQARPLLGIGEDNFDYFFERFKVEGFYDTTVHPHNDYLTVLVSSGAPGLFSFVVLWILAIQVGLKTWRESGDEWVRTASLGAAMSLIGFLVGGLFQNYYGTFINCLEWWFLVGLIFVAYRLRGGDALE